MNARLDKWNKSMNISVSQSMSELWETSEKKEKVDSKECIMYLARCNSRLVPVY